MSLRGFESNFPITNVWGYQGPKKIIVGAGGVEASVGREAKRFGQKVLLVTDKGVRKTGLADKVSNLLSKESLKVEIYDEISGEPTADVMRKAVAFGRQGNYDVIIGVGGGSSIDTAKMIAACLTNPGDLMTLVNPIEDVIKISTRPKILIPTTSGTGSEATPDSVMIEGIYKTFASSPNLFAEVAIVDPVMALTGPPRLTAVCALDALAQNVETFLGAFSNPISDSQALEGARLIFSYLRRAYDNGSDLEARWGLSMAAMMGGIVIGYPWTKCLSLGHCIAEAAGPKWKIPHGAICGLALPYFLEFSIPACSDKLARLASVIGADVHGMSTREAAHVAVQEVVDLLNDVEMPLSLKEWGVQKQEIQEFSDYIYNERQHMYLLPKFNSRKLTQGNTRKLMESMYEGNIGQV
ncbi:MAG: iron-containing alcohol dehydrogenase [Candidatus Bathyarchaeia archaeon]